MDGRLGLNSANVLEKEPLGELSLSCHESMLELVVCCPYQYTRAGNIPKP